jgi:hypothetical protein
MTLRHALAVAFVLLSFSSLASADEKRAAAREIFEAAQRLYQEENFRAAALAFEAAYEKSPSAGTLFAAGMSWERAGESARAADALTKAVDGGGLDQGSLDEARARLSELVPRLGRIRVRAGESGVGSVAHVSGAPTPLAVYVAPGRHRVTVAFPGGGTGVRDVDVSAGELEIVEIAPPSLPVAERKATPVQSSTPVTKPPALATWGFIGLGTGAALGVAGSVMLVRGLDARDDFDASGDTDADARDRAIGLRTWGNVALVAGGVVATTGLVLILVDGGAERAELGLGFRAGSVLATGRF